MDWNQFKQVDPCLLVGLVNTELRNHAESLNDFCRTHDIDEAQLRARLEKLNYHYQEEHNQFRWKKNYKITNK